MLLAVLLCGSVAAAEVPALWLDVPFVKQAPEGCGAASIAMVMQYWFALDGQTPGDQADAGYILRSLHSRAGHGIYASAMAQYFEGTDFMRSHSPATGICCNSIFRRDARSSSP